MAWVLFAHLECHPPIDGNIPDDSGGATRPENFQLDGCIVVAQPKMEDEIVLITLPGAGLHLSSENASVGQRQPDLSPDCGEVDLFSGIAEEADFQPVVVSGGTIHEKLACGHEIEISVVVKVSKHSTGYRHTLEDLQQTRTLSDVFKGAIATSAKQT